MVITAGLAFPLAANNGNTMDTRHAFVQDMYADERRGRYFDALGDHPYTYPNTPDTAASGPRGLMMNQVRPLIACASL